MLTIYTVAASIFAGGLCSRSAFSRLAVRINAVYAADLTVPPPAASSSSVARPARRAASSSALRARAHRRRPLRAASHAPQSRLLGRPVLIVPLAGQLTASRASTSPTPKDIGPTSPPYPD